METKHTPGKWIFNFDSKELVNEENETVPMPNHFGSYPRPEEEVFGDLEEWNQAQANAKLIAASPDMLKEHIMDLKHLKGWRKKLIAANLRGSILFAEYQEMIEAKEKVIRKATGDGE